MSYEKLDDFGFRRPGTRRHACDASWSSGSDPSQQRIGLDRPQHHNHFWEFLIQQ